ncbi:uncharacterized protein LOC134847981 isoform X2 [Symsagittifera roscoffensis]|uniref:uncharacterized protein LOC134847981 isoform X2 n=1 Tax=Symsagittifera roscoffensis TaxID=84072 RepID=UPI00307C8284
MGRNKRKSRKVRQICQLNTNSNAELTSSDTVWSAPLDARKKLTLKRKYRESCKRYEEEFQKFTLLRESNNAKMHNSLQTKKFTTLNYIDPGFVLSSETEHVSETLRDPRPLSSVVKSEKWPRQVSEDFLGSQSFAEARTARPVKDKTGHVDNEFTTAFSSGNTQMQDMAKAARKLTKRRLCDVPMGNAIEDPNEIKVTNVCSTEESEGLYEVDLHVEYKIKGSTNKDYKDLFDEFVYPQMDFAYIYDPRFIFPHHTYNLARLINFLHSKTNVKRVILETSPRQSTKSQVLSLN